MQQPEFWTKYAEAMELSAEGSRLIAQEIAGMLQRLWQRVAGRFDGMLETLGRLGHQPPV